MYPCNRSRYSLSLNIPIQSVGEGEIELRCHVYFSANKASMLIFGVKDGLLSDCKSAVFRTAAPNLFNFLN